MDVMCSVVQVLAYYQKGSVVILKMARYTHIFEYMAPSWWTILEKIREYDFGEGCVSLEMGFDISKQTSDTVSLFDYKLLIKM